jgi:hypothetical protein
MEKRLGMRIVTISLLCVFVALGAWASLYPHKSDPKNLRYMLWKAGLFQMDLDIACGTMTGDRHRDELVVGKSKEQLRREFGYLLSPKEASPYLRHCYKESSWNDKDVLFLRTSPWMVVFDGDRAARLILIKGC